MNISRTLQSRRTSGRVTCSARSTSDPGEQAEGDRPSSSRTIHRSLSLWFMEFSHLPKGAGRPRRLCFIADQFCVATLVDVVGRGRESIPDPYSTCHLFFSYLLFVEAVSARANQPQTMGQIKVRDRERDEQIMEAWKQIRRRASNAKSGVVELEERSSACRVNDDTRRVRSWILARGVAVKSRGK